MHAKLPEHLINRPVQRLRDMPAGGTWHFVFTDLVVDRNRNCYLRASAERKGDGVSRIDVRRDADGYHIILREFIQFESEPLLLRPLLLLGRLIPVASITEEYER